MDVVDQILGNINTWLIMFTVGIIVWVVRQILPEHMEHSRLWHVLLRVVPVGLGILIALIPGLQPIPDSMVQSGAVGMIAGSFSQTVYGLLREVVSEKMKAKLGSRVDRISMCEGDGERS